MKDSAYEVLKAVMLAEGLVFDLAPYPHHSECPASKTVGENCMCYAKPNNARLEKVKELIRKELIQDAIDFVAD